MKKSLIVSMVFGIMLAFGSLANAVPIVDVVQSPTGYFVDSDAHKYDSPYYRWNGDDWGWKHNAIGGTITSASLNISAFDVDNPTDQPFDPEMDLVYAYDDGVKTLLGNLTGVSDTWSFATFNLGSSFFNDINSGLQVWLEIDSGDTGWAVTLAKSALSVDGAQLPNPNPGAAVPEPSTFLLLGAGLAGIGFLRKRVRG